jgi:uncharacterized protein YndB with AHSA1/START domain
MKYTFETVIDAPIEKVAKLAGDPSLRIQWMEGMKDYKSINGTPGQPGAVSRMVFKTGTVEMVFTGTVKENNLPDYFTEIMDASNVTTSATTRLDAISPDKTRYISEQDHDFKGLFNKLVGFVLQREFKTQTRRHMDRFKQFVEKQ